jgi:hypothetical protein
MSIRSSQAITTQFTTRVFSTGVLTDADSTPTGTLYVNGTANGASVTVTKISTGLYKAAFTLPTLSVGDWCCVIIAATVSSVSDSAKVWEDTKDIVIDAAGLADANTVKIGPTGNGTAQTATDIGATIGAAGAGLTSIGDGRLANLDAAVSTRSTYAGGDTSGTTTLLERLTSTRAGLLDNLDAAITSRMATFSYTTPPTTAAIVTAIMTDLTSSTDFNTSGSFGKLIKDYLDAAVSSRLATSGYTAPPTAAQNRAEMDSNSTRLAHLDADVSSRLAGASYTAPDNTGIAAAESAASDAATQTTATSIRSAVGLAAADLDTQLAAIPTTIRIKKNTAFNGFSFAMFDSDGVPATGKTVTSTVAIDGASFVSLTNSPSEIGSGAYKVDLTQADTNGNDLLFLFTASGCKSLFLKVVTQP